MPPTHNTLRFTHTPATSQWANPLMAMDNGSPPKAGHILPLTQSPYFDTDKLRALSVYAETGNASVVEDQTGISRHTVGRWVAEDSTPALLDELRSTIRYECGWQLASMVKRGLKRIEDAWDRGNPHVLKDGRVIYVPASSKDATIEFSILLDKWMLVSGALSQSNAIVSRLDQLGHALRDIGSGLLAGSDSPPPSLSPAPKGGPLTGDHPGENLVW